MRIYSAAVIGCGRIGSLLERDKLRAKPATHAALYARHPRARLVAGCELDPARRAAFSLDWGVPAARVYADYRNLLEQERPEIVSIATWTASHAAIAIAAARAGARIILCEKPMAIDLAEADAMIRACRDEGALLAIHHERRWNPWFRAARRLIEAGELGEIRTVIGNVLTGPPSPDWHASPRIAGGGPTLHDGTHLFDILRYLCGGITAMRGEATRHDPELRVEDTARVVLRFANGATAFVECGGRRAYFNFELDIQGSRGRLQIGNSLLRYWGIGPSPRYEGFVEFAERPFPRGDEPDYYPYIVDELIEACETGRPSVSSGEEGRAALAAILELYQGKSPLFW
jgi:predicted dehydrogenase